MSWSRTRPTSPRDARESLPPDVREFEPALALFGGRDGLDVLRALASEAAGVLARGTGWLILECGQGQAGVVQRLLEATGQFGDIEAVADLQGIPRAVLARRRGRG